MSLLNNKTIMSETPVPILNTAFPLLTVDTSATIGSVITDSVTTNFLQVTDLVGTNARLTTITGASSILRISAPTVLLSGGVLADNIRGLSLNYTNISTQNLRANTLTGLSTVLTISSKHVVVKTDRLIVDSLSATQFVNPFLQLGISGLSQNGGVEFMMGNAILGGLYAVPDLSTVSTGTTFEITGGLRTPNLSADFGTITTLSCTTFRATNPSFDTLSATTARVTGTMLIGDRPFEVFLSQPGTRLQVFNNTIVDDDARGFISNRCFTHQMITNRWAFCTHADTASPHTHLALAGVGGATPDPDAILHFTMNGLILNPNAVAPITLESFTGQAGFRNTGTTQLDGDVSFGGNIALTGRFTTPVFAPSFTPGTGAVYPVPSTAIGSTVTRAEALVVYSTNTGTHIRNIDGNFTLTPGVYTINLALQVRNFGGVINPDVLPCYALMTTSGGDPRTVPLIEMCINQFLDTTTVTRTSSRSYTRVVAGNTTLFGNIFYQSTGSVTVTVQCQFTRIA